MQPLKKEIERYKVVGKPTKRVDSPGKLTGQTRYAGDIPIAGLLYARLVLSPYAHARILHIDVSDALLLPQVKAVYTREDLNRATRNGKLPIPQSLLADREVLWCGQPVAVVLADTEAAAQDGVDAVDVEYELLPGVIDPLKAMPSDAPLVHLLRPDLSEQEGDTTDQYYIEPSETEEEKHYSKNVVVRSHYSCGDLKVAMEMADIMIEHTYQTSFIHQSYMEPQSVTVLPDKSGQLTIWSCAQGMLALRSTIANALQLPEQQIRVEPVSIGGSFGGKGGGVVEILAAALAIALHKPIRLVYTRSEDLLAGNPAPQSRITVRLGAMRDGTLVAMQAQVIFDTGAYSSEYICLGGTLLGSLYQCPHIDVHYYEVVTNKVRAGAYRAPGGPQATFALEATIDDLCRALAMDPIAFRQKNALPAGNPTLERCPVEQPVTYGLWQCLEQAKKQSLWREQQEQRATQQEMKGWKIGVGVAAAGWPTCTTPAAATCHLERDGSISVVVGTVDLTGTDTSLALIAAEESGIPLSAVRIIHANTDVMPYSGSSGGSKTTYSMGLAVQAAAKEARTQILSIAADILEANVDDLAIQQDRVVTKDMAGKDVALAKIAAVSTGLGGKYEPVYGRGRAAPASGSPMFAVHIAKIAADPETGEVRVLDYVVVQDVGTAINPAEIEGQICGGVMQGLSWSLFESLEYDDEGQLLTTTLMDYALPRCADTPKITSILLETRAPLGPFGAKGVGEIPIVPVSAAISNAIADALNVRMTQLPITAERLFRALTHAEKQ